METNSNNFSDEEYVSCEYLQSGLNMHTLNISTCNWFTKGLVFYKFDEPVGGIRDPQTENIDFKKIDEMRKKTIESREIPENCKGCFNLKKKKWNYTGKISNIEIDHWRNCNCGCIYCSNRNHDFCNFLTTEVTKSQFYDVYPILEGIKKYERLDDKITIQTIGGEPAALDEYSKIIQFFIDIENEKLSKTEIGMLTSGIVYIPEIAKVLESQDKFLTISLDCGCRETYKKIKQIDAFDVCVSNIEEYIKHAMFKFQVILKYIFLPNINDNKEEIDKFFGTVKKVGCKQVNFSLEFCQSIRYKQGNEIPENLYGLFDYAKSKAEEAGILYQVYDVVKDLLKKGYY